MEHRERELLAERLLEACALRVEPGAEKPLVWAEEKAWEDPGLRGELTEALAALVREHYSAGEAVLGDAWGEETAALLELPFAPETLPRRPVLIFGTSEGLRPHLPELTALRRAGGSPAAAVIWNGGDEELRLALDRADIRCHWLADLECGAAAALRAGSLDFSDYCRLLPQD
ncbi:MAG: hypothetical protein J5633_07145 [Oscillospiraceae bacterium]|nr:hypothetical protein [Oscillospiraceae bacterium]